MNSIKVLVLIDFCISWNWILIGYNSCVYPGGRGAGNTGVMNKYVSSDKVDQRKENGAVQPKVSSSLCFLLIFIVSIIFHVNM